MSQELPIATPLGSRPAEVVQEPLVETPEVPVTPHSPEEIQAIDAVFAQKKESDLAAGLMTIWAGIPLLHDLAKEHFERPEEGPEVRKSKEEDE